jgi:hypothetical protein
MRVVPIAADGATLYVACDSVLAEQDIETLQQHTSLRVRQVLATPESLDWLLQQMTQRSTRRSSPAAEAHGQNSFIVKIDFSSEAYKALQTLAGDRPVGDVIREALRIEKMVRDYTAGGGRVIFEKDGERRVLALS